MYSLHTNWGHWVPKKSISSVKCSLLNNSCCQDVRTVQGEIPKRNYAAGVYLYEKHGLCEPEFHLLIQKFKLQMLCCMFWGFAIKAGFFLMEFWSIVLICRQKWCVFKVSYHTFLFCSLKWVYSRSYFLLHLCIFLKGKEFITFERYFYALSWLKGLFYFFITWFIESYFLRNCC